MEINIAQQLLGLLKTQKQGELDAVTLALSVLDSTFAPEIESMKALNTDNTRLVVESKEKQVEIVELNTDITRLMSENKELETNVVELQTDNARLMSAELELLAEAEVLPTEAAVVEEVV